MRDDERTTLSWLAEHTGLDLKDIEFIAISELVYPDYDAESMTLSMLGLGRLLEHLQELGPQD
jgi:hypothetical protein